MATKRDKDVIRELESLGYGHDRTNSKGIRFYVHEATGCEVRTCLGLDERKARQVLNQARHLVGLSTREGKRNPQQIKERNDAERARAAAELDRIRAERDTAASEQQIRDIEEQYLRAERKFRYWDRMVRESSAA